MQLDFDLITEHILFADYDDDTPIIEVESAAFVYAVEYADKPGEISVDFDRFMYGLQYLADNNKIPYFKLRQHQQSARAIYDQSVALLQDRKRLIAFLEFTIKGGNKVNDLAKFKRVLRHLKSYH